MKDEVTVKHGLEVPKRKRRFPKFNRALDVEGREYWFYDNNTENGLFIIGFELVNTGTSLMIRIINEHPSTIHYYL